MSHHGRVLRSNTSLTTQRVVSSPLAPKASNPHSDIIQIVGLESKLPGITVTELKLLREKQKKLAGTAPSTLKRLTGKPHISNALEATLIFAQYEAGTAVCVDRAGWVLTCAHCFGDTEEEYKESSKRKWLLFYTGLAVQVECRAWDPKRDLALLKIITVESSQEVIPPFPYVTLAMESPSSKMSVICIGQPGRDDLESTSDRRTKYKLVEISEGTFCGMVEGADFQDNSEIGTLMHDAWTYWGHSGAPLLRERDGTLIGLHSSWDDETAMRHGVPHVAIKKFLEQEAIIPLPYKIEDS